MGNCGYRLNQKVFRLYNNLKGHSSQSDQLICPNCQKQFEQKISNSMFNSHLDSCLRNPMSLINNQRKDDLTQQVEKKVIFKQNINNKKWKKVQLSKEKVQGILSNSLKEINEKEFEEKMIWFRNRLGKRKISWTEGSDYILINKQSIIPDTLEFLDACDFLKELHVRFEGETVSDAGGLIREWVTLLVEQLFSKQEGIFQQNKEGYYAFQQTGLDEHVIQRIRLAARVLAKSILERITVTVSLSHVLIKHLLGLPLCMDDLKTNDIELYQNVQYIINHSIQNDEFMSQQTFIVQHNATNGLYQELELIPGGKNIYLDDDNKQLFAEKLVDFYLSRRIEVELNIFLYEFYEIIPKSLVDIFSVQEFEMLLNGIDEINVEDWKKNTLYKGIYTEKHKTIKWFWKIVEDELDVQQKQTLVQFTTGLKRIPVEGFGFLESNRGKICLFNIEDSKQLKAMTCFNRLYIPICKDYQTLKLKIIEICKSDFEGVFGLQE